VARKGAEGELIISGHTGQVVKTDRDYRAYAGLAPDLFAGDEIPSPLIGRGLVHGWATASLYGHAPEVQVSRCACL
jgi:hypothetical protein